MKCEDAKIFSPFHVNLKIMNYRRIKYEMVEQAKKVLFEVRENFFTCDKSLFIQYPESFLNVLVNGKFSESSFEASKAILVDYDPIVFKTVLDYYQFGDKILEYYDLKKNSKELVEAADYFMLECLSERIDICGRCGDVYDILNIHGLDHKHYSHKYSVYVKKLVCQSVQISEDSFHLILNEVLNRYPFKKMHLMYQASVHGFSAKDFHSKCDGFENFLVFILSKESYVFGGFSAVSFDTSNRVKPDPNSFLFSLNLNKEIKILLPQDTFSGPNCKKNVGPSYGISGREDLYLNSNCDVRGGYTKIGINSGYHDISQVYSRLFTPRLPMDEFSGAQLGNITEILGIYFQND